jgi:hypothetical protein
VIGLTGGQDWSIRGVAVTADGVRHETEATTVSVAAPPSALPRFVLQSSVAADRDNPDALLFVLVVQEDDSRIVALDENAEYAWWMESEGRRDIDGLHAEPGGGGLVFTHFGVNDTAGTGIGHVRFDGTVTRYDPAPEGHHDAIARADGVQFYIRAELTENAPLEGGTETTLSADSIWRLDAGADTPRRLFGFSDGYPHEPWRTCAHFNQETAGGGHDFSHSNSLMLDEAEGEVLVMSKNLDSLTAVDAESGEFKWQIGGRYSDFRDVAGDDPPDDETAWRVDGPAKTWWSHGHMSDYWRDGMLVFDNGYHHNEVVSRVVEYRIDHDAKTIEKVQDWPSPAGTFNPILGDARRLPNGNRMLAYTLEGRVSEVTATGDVVWDAVLELGAGAGRLVVVDDPYAEDTP